MKSQRTVYLPAIAAAIISILLIAYSFYAISTGNAPHPPQGAGGPRPPGGPGHKEAFEPFKIMGTLAVIFGAVSFFWLRFKKKLVSGSPVVKKLAKLFYKAHQITGWIAFALVLAHGVYYLITKIHDRNIYTGLATFLILLALGGYGWFLRRKRHPIVRKIHFALSILWIPALLLHAGGSAIATVLVIAVLWVGVAMLEKATQAQPVEN